ncbi:MAG: SGNH/GDSL hydrolase family protein [Ignavibacteriales bacterium]
MKKIIRIGIMLIFFIVVFVILNMLFQPKYATNLVEGSMISQYYNEVKDHEVIFIGDCEVYANFSPMVMYETSGIKAYIRGSSQQMIWQSYIILKETLKYEIPKVVVFNVNSIRYDKESEKVSEAYNRLTIDKMKWSKEKIEIIKESMTEDEGFMSYVFPILRYHSRYNQLTNEDFEYLFKRKDNTYNGFLMNKNIKGVTNLPTEKKLASYDFSEESYHYLELILKLCEENNIELVLVKAPSLYPYWYEEYDKQIKDFAKENDIDYYNLKDYANIIGIDYSKDTYDGGLHLNLTGATKLSEFFARVLSSRYDLTNYKGDPLYNAKLKIYKEKIK